MQEEKGLPRKLAVGGMIDDLTCRGIRHARREDRGRDGIRDDAAQGVAPAVPDSQRHCTEEARSQSHAKRLSSAWLVSGFLAHDGFLISRVRERSEQFRFPW